MSKQRPFAVFDIDGTVIRWQLYHGIVHELGKRGIIPSDSTSAVNNARMTWKKRANSDSFGQFEHEFVHTFQDSLAHIAVSDYLDVVDKVFEEHKDQVYTYTRDLIQDLKSKGYVLFTISGSQHEIIEKLGRYYGFDDYVGASFKAKNGFFTRPDREVFGRKGELLRELISKHNVTSQGSIAVGDSESDIAMFEMVETPLAFNPTAGLYTVAKQKGWDIVVERKNVVYQLRQVAGRYILL